MLADDVGVTCLLTPRFSFPWLRVSQFLLINCIQFCNSFSFCESSLPLCVNSIHDMTGNTNIHQKQITCFQLLNLDCICFSFYDTCKSWGRQVVQKLFYWSHPDAKKFYDKHNSDYVLQLVRGSVLYWRWLITKFIYISYLTTIHSNKNSEWFSYPQGVA